METNSKKGCRETIGTARLNAPKKDVNLNGHYCGRKAGHSGIHECRGCAFVWGIVTATARESWSPDVIE